MKSFDRLYVGDTVVCILLAALLALSALILPYFRSTGKGSGVRVLLDGKEAAVLSLSEEVQDIAVGGVHIKIEDGRAYIFASSCPDGLCERMHGVDSKGGGGAVCVPNRVVLEPADSSDTHYVVG